MKYFLAMVATLALPVIYGWLEWAPPVKVPFLTWDHVGVYVHGDPDVSYTVEYSTTLVNWVPVAVLKGDGSGPVPFTGRGTGFFRARG